MRKTVIKEYDCNDCGHASCHGDMIRRKNKVFKTICPGHVELDHMETTLFEKSLEHEGSMTAWGAILESVNLRIVEIPRRPGFRLVERERR